MARKCLLALLLVGFALPLAGCVVVPARPPGPYGGYWVPGHYNGWRWVPGHWS